jgi:hypothetical protein
MFDYFERSRETLARIAAEIRDVAVSKKEVVARRKLNNSTTEGCVATL